MYFRQHALKIILGIEDFRSIPHAALQALKDGFDTPSLYILAGLSKYDDTFDIRHYYDIALHELGIELPDKRTAAIEIALSIADEIFDNKRDIIEGSWDIKRIAIDAYPFYEESKHYCYDSIHFEKIYGILDQINELRHAHQQWQPAKTNAELEQEYSVPLMNELRKWYTLMKVTIK
ncbi:hypothetical protein [Chitinophaga sp. 212800010-3]|uniref:hypothetical protein n=1 Tax=unclassified Chitinophaga TaxID=2619133 RepID=UPI002DF08DC1|nr:hypothetical protein [Chitinophaga sp. 212800010-3]